MISCDICKRFVSIVKVTREKKRKLSDILIFTNQKMHSNKWKGLFNTSLYYGRERA